MVCLNLFLFEEIEFSRLLSLLRLEDMLKLLFCFCFFSGFILVVLLEVIMKYIYDV